MRLLLFANCWFVAFFSVPIIMTMTMKTIPRCHSLILHPLRKVWRPPNQPRTAHYILWHRKHSVVPFLGSVPPPSKSQFMANTALFFSTQQQQHNIESDDSMYQELRRVSQEIQRNDDLYYNFDGLVGSIIPDDDFDALVRYEEDLSRKYPQLLEKWQQESGKGIAATRTGRVGAKVNGSDALNDQIPVAAAAATKNNEPRLKRQHLSPMLSLDNAQNDEQLHAWLRRVIKAATELHRLEQVTGKEIQVTVVTEPKLDGLSLSLRYERCGDTFQLQWASTRGDGKVGQDVTTAVLQMQLPASFSSSSGMLNGVDVLEVRGEVVFPTSEFKRLQATSKEDIERIRNLKEAQETVNAAGTNSPMLNTTTTTTSTISTFANARNAASGILLRKESDNEGDQLKASELRSLQKFFAYDVAVKSKDGQSAASVMETRDLLREWGFSVTCPAATAKLYWTVPTNETLSDSVAISEEWFLEEIVKTGQIASMMTYYSALRDHRISLTPDDMQSSDDLIPQQDDKSSAKAKKKRMSSPTFEWGDYDTDGCVHKVSDADLRRFMGNSMKSPKHAVAHKFPAQSVVTHLLDIIVQVGRTGALTPVAILDPVEVGGVTVQRATLHNFGHMKEVLRKDAPDGTDTTSSIRSNLPVVVRRAGEVIPQVVRSLHPSESSDSSGDVRLISLEPPKTCPSCGSDVVWDEVKATNSTQSSVGQVVRCGGPPLLCSPRAITSLAHAYSRDALDVNGLSEARIQQLLDVGLLRYPSDIFGLNESDWETVAELPGWGKKSCSNLRQSAERVSSGGISLDRFVYSLGIRHVGKHTAELVAESYGKVKSFFKEVDEAQNLSSRAGKDVALDSNETTLPFPTLQNKLGIGPVVLESLSEFAQTPDLVDAAKNLSSLVLVLEQEAENERRPDADEQEVHVDRPWKGYRVVFTGTLEGISRSEAQKLAKMLGARATPGSVSKSTDLVVYGDKGGKKLEQARSFGVSTMTADEFLAIVKAKELL